MAVDKLIKNQCCGCNACGDICPKDAISFKSDIEGFWYPHIDTQKCINCDLCEKICPSIQKANHIIRYEEPKVYGAYTKDDKIRVDSTSGGIHSMLAKQVYYEGGYVGGAIYNDDHTVSHFISDNPEDLDKIRSSKYLQSSLIGQYKIIRDLLKKNKTVLYCGAPCQIQALYKFLNKDYENLITCDFICRGVNSPKVFIKYIQMLENEYGAKVSGIKFKHKKWGWHNFSTKIEFENGKEYIKDRYHDLFYIGYLQAGNFSRPSCYDCQFKGFPQKADITLADFWGIEKLDPSMDQDKGTSLVMINSNKGEALFDKIKERIVYKPFTFEEARNGNPAINESLKVKYGNRDEFFKDLNSLPFNIVAEKHFPAPSKNRTNYIQRLRNLRSHLGVLHATYNRLGLSFRDWRTFAQINLLQKGTVASKRFLFVNYKNTIIELQKNAILRLKGQLNIGIPQVKGSNLETRILVEENGVLEIKNKVNIFSTAYLRVIKNGRLSIGNCMINEGVQIIADSPIEIGDNSLIARDVVIRSYDAHSIDIEGYKISKPIKIGNHVWIGQGAYIHKGVTIGEGAIIGARSVVNRDIPAHCIAVGNPAKVVKENITWKG